MPTHVRVCGENKLEEYVKNNCPLKIFRRQIRYYPRNTKEMDFSMFTCNDALQHEGTKTVLCVDNDVWNSRILALVSETSTKVMDQAGSQK